MALKAGAFRKGFVATIGAVAFAAAGFFGAGDAHALNQGDIVDFAVPLGTELTTGAAGDIVIFTGKSMATTVLDSCGWTGQWPIQSFVAIDPGDPGSSFYGSARATRGSELVVTSSMDSIRNGTRVGNLQLVNPCAINGNVYIKYRGTVELTVPPF